MSYVPLRIRITEALKQSPDGLSTQDLEKVLGVPRYTVSAMVSKIHAYGGPVEKTGPPRGKGTVWKWK